MRIGFDVDSLTIKSGGIGRYAVNLVNNIAKTLLCENQNEIFIFIHNSFDINLIEKYSRLTVLDKYTRIKSNILRKGVFLPFSIQRLKISSPSSPSFRLEDSSSNARSSHRWPPRPRPPPRSR